MKEVNSETRICEWPDDSELGQKPAQNTKIIKINDVPSFPQLYGWTVCLPCVGSEIQENLKFFLSKRVKKIIEIPSETGIITYFGKTVQERRIWQIWEVEELEPTRRRQEAGLQLPKGY